MKPTLTIFAALVFSLPAVSADNPFSENINNDYRKHLGDLFAWFHRNPELSLTETRTAGRLAKELRTAGFTVTEKVGGTGVVAILGNGAGPMVMLRADMDGLPLQEKTGLAYASTATQDDPITGNKVPVMHACGHDVHVTSLVGTARYMASHKSDWSGTLMLIGQPAEERGLGAQQMLEDHLWERFGTPDYLLAFHVGANHPTGTINLVQSPFAGADAVDIIIHGTGTHGAAPQFGKDPIVLGSQIVLALQTLVSRELSPRAPGVVTVGSFHAGTKHNIIPDEARLQLTVRSTSHETRKLLLDGIQRIAVNMGRVAGLPEDRLPEVIFSKDSVPPTINDAALMQRLRAAWTHELGAEAITTKEPDSMGAEDYPLFIGDPAIPSVYFIVGGTPAADILRAENGGAPVAPHHSPLFQVEPQASVTTGVEASVTALDRKSVV